MNAWNRNLIPWWLLIPQGVSGAIKRRAGFGPFRELGYRPLALGEARHTGAGQLPFRGIIHVAAIDGFWRASEQAIAKSALSAIQMAEQHGYRSIAMPLLGAGSGGFSTEESERVITDAVRGCRDIDITVVRFGR